MKLYSKLAVAALLLAGVTFSAPVVVTDALAACDFCGGPSHNKPAPVPTPTTKPVAQPVTLTSPPPDLCEDKSKKEKVCCRQKVSRATPDNPTATELNKGKVHGRVSAYNCCKQNLNAPGGTTWGSVLGYEGRPLNECPEPDTDKKTGIEISDPEIGI